VAFFESSLKERKFLSEAATRYGLVASLLRARDIARAQRELEPLRKTASPIIESLACRVSEAAGDAQKTLACYQAARRSYPNQRALFYGHVEQLVRVRRPEEALQLISERLQGRRDDPRLYRLQAQAYAAQGNQMMQHRAQSEAYVLTGHLGAAVEQLQIALKAGQGDFYQMSSIEARLRELRRMQLEQERKR
jgi:predicted Zn-dependent protease